MNRKKKTLNKNLKEKLIRAASEARKNAYVPYSQFPLGAAVLTSDGSIFTGNNIENASYGLTNCAERTALFKAVSEGYRDFTALVLVSDNETPVSPCGACRQVINEFGQDIIVVMVNLEGDEIVKTGRELLPASFDGKELK